MQGAPCLRGNPLPVGARAVKGGWEGLYGRPRPVRCAHLWGNALTPPAPGDHKGPPLPTSSALAPTDQPASCLASRLSLMRMGGPLWSPAVPPSSRLRGQVAIG